MGRELFGTDGVRGLAGQYPLDQPGAERIGMAIGTHFAQPGQEIILGIDTRESSPELEAILTSGMTAVGANVISLGVIPTPGVAYLTRQNRRFVAGVMVTASHNPYKYNGVKVFDGNGDKLSDSTEAQLNSLIEQGTNKRDPGESSRNDELIKEYEDFLVGSAAGFELDGLRVAIDTANGAASGIAERVFSRLGARVTALFDTPDGRNINAGCGATDTAALRREVAANKLALGIALDGDADRIALVDGQARAMSGDQVMYVLAVAGKLNGVVATAMSNLGLETALKAQGIALERVDVGDRYVLEGLRRTGFGLGGEQSGHIIFPELLKTGDGLLAAVQTVRAVIESGKSLAQWRDELELLPQALVNIPLENKSWLERPEVQAFLAEQTGILGNTGRLLIRPSGTEPLARVMVEAPDAEQAAQKIAAKLQDLLARQISGSQAS